MFSVIEGSISLIVQCGSVVKTLKDIAETHAQAKLTIMSMVQEIETIDVAWNRIKEWSQHHAETNADKGDTNGLDASFISQVKRSLQGGTLIMSALQDDLACYINKADSLSFKQHSKVTWNQKALQDHQNRIRGQVVAMGLLLQTLALQSPKSRRRFLKKKKRQFRKSNESASSIVPSELSSRLSSRHSLSSNSTDNRLSFENADLVYRRLSFENGLFHY